MKRIALAAALTLGSALSAQAADPAIGIWQTQVDEGSFAMVNMYACGPAVCGTITRTFKADGTEYDSPNKGKQIVMNMTPQGDGAYAGEVLRPADNKTYIGKMQITGNDLALKGCVAGGLICKSQSWKKLQ
ncbi:DUF2147 domain-containing protein [Maritimibacter sp. DP1N21-5]|uniref:DUF2147 domain-containing protein n=1 Tax=Maritimibacter sp. DP1N21-5 TaxID=2836867 RepID=UPI001C457DA5|nr:DUF2147 domain-containing protein [Maritimibacter sp. DP1N21-5]MBV7409266.1 DUF2147 domain-containing protein [Maritimibacter sp. DP1N21-5]